MREKAPLEPNLTWEPRKMKEDVQTLWAGDCNLFLLGTHVKRPEVMFLTPVSLFFYLSLLTGDHENRSRERR